MVKALFSACFSLVISYLVKLLYWIDDLNRKADDKIIRKWKRLKGWFK